jgi:pimeloyl-ACP methyl ester carboxylesterase
MRTPAATGPCSCCCTAAADTGFLLKAAERLPGFNHPALIVWASGDRVMPPEHGQRLAKLLPHGQLVEVEDSYTLVPLDQPARLAQIIREFTRTSESVIDGRQGPGPSGA